MNSRLLTYIIHTTSMLKFSNNTLIHTYSATQRQAGHLAKLANFHFLFCPLITISYELGTYACDSVGAFKMPLQIVYTLYLPLFADQAHDVRQSPNLSADPN